MYNEDHQEISFPRTKELTADLTIVPEPKTLGWFGRLIRQRDKGGTIFWTKEDEEEEEAVTINSLQYNPSAPHGGYYVMPVMYAPSQGEEEQIYGMGEIAVYETEQYRDQFYTDIRTCDVEPAEEDDDRLYYKEFSNLETEVDISQNYVETPNYETLQKPRTEEFTVEPHIAPLKPGPVVCRNETGQCSCSRNTYAFEACKRSNSCEKKQQCSEPKREKTKEAKSSHHDVCYTVLPTLDENALFSPSTILTTDQEEKLYISVDSYTDNTVVESRSIQTFKDEQNCSCSTQTLIGYSDSEFCGKPSATIIRPDSCKKRTYSILTGQMKKEEDGAIDKEAATLNVRKLKSAKPSKCDPICNLAAKSGSSAGPQLTAAKKKTKDK